MPSEQQLERSVLERKEREELRAIAQAMSLQTTSRSKKADIIDSILRAAGVEVTEPTTKVNGSEPRRTRKAVVSTAVEADADATPAASNGKSASSPSPESANGSGEHQAVAAAAPVQEAVQDQVEPAPVDHAPE